jgi:uncharacterized integral membrane protein (TIGR00698 family)
VVLAMAVVAALSLASLISVGVALVAGMAVSLVLGNPWPARTRAFAHQLLGVAVAGLGAGADLGVVGRVGLHGLGYTAIGICFALGFGTWLGRRLRVDPDASLLVSVGTAICGGSAIAAVAPVIRAKHDALSLALVSVFLLNGVALFVFPIIGHRLALSQESFGLWCALAIHDTSSVVGAAAQYGARALEVATAAKLARALWIVPVTFFIASIRARRHATTRSRVLPPWFILGFLLAAALVTFAPALAAPGQLVASFARRLLALTLFLIGMGFTRRGFQELGLAPFALAVVLWGLLAAGTLAGLTYGWIS